MGWLVLAQVWRQRGPGGLSGAPTLLTLAALLLLLPLLPALLSPLLTLPALLMPPPLPLPQLHGSLLPPLTPHRRQPRRP